VILPLAGLSLVCWSTSANGGVSSDKLIDTSAKTSTAVFAWGIIAQFNSVMGANSALLVTVPDLARYSKTKNAQLYGQAIGLPLAQTICAAFGIITTSAVKNMYGEAYWNPYDLLNGILDEGYTSKARAGVCFASASFAFATLGTSIACNITPFAADVTCLAPKYINIIRGQFLCLIIAFAIVPWRIVATANGFLNFLGGYSIFQGPVVAIMIIDYFVIRKGNMSIEDIYSLSSNGRYFYFGGVNLRAFAAFIIGFLLPLSGFVASFGYKIGLAASHMYALGWVLSFVMGCLSYWVICLVFKVPGDDGRYPWEGKVEESQLAIVDGVHLNHGVRERVEEVVHKEKGFHNGTVDSV
jgi:NCS1 family nucleobase:cation symporter-1